MYNQPFHTVDLKDRTFLVTGGAGFIGSHLIEYLLKYNVGKVKSLDNYSNGFRKNLEFFKDVKNLEIIDGDITSIEDCIKACKGVDYVLHQAALGSVPRSIKDPITTNKVNIGGFINMLEASKMAGIKRFVYAASSSTYGDSKVLPKVEHQIGRPLSPYAVTKYVNELYADVFDKTYGLDCVGLRYFNIFGPRQDPKGAYAAVIPLFIDAILQGKAPNINGDGEQTRDFTFVENAVQANIKAALCEHMPSTDKVFNVAYHDRNSLNQLINNLNEIAGTTIQATYGSPRAGDVRDSFANIDKAGKVFGYKPNISLEEGLAITFNWFKENDAFIKERE